VDDLQKALQNLFMYYEVCLKKEEGHF
jgi:hypothetical protein